MDDGNSGDDAAVMLDRWIRPMEWGGDEGKSGEESLRGTRGEEGDGEMLDPSWTPERGRSHVAALLESADGRQS